MHSKLKKTAAKKSKVKQCNINKNTWWNTDTEKISQEKSQPECCHKGRPPPCCHK